MTAENIKFKKQKSVVSQSVERDRAQSNLQFLEKKKLRVSAEVYRLQRSCIAANCRTFEFFLHSLNLAFALCKCLDYELP